MQVFALPCSGIDKEKILYMLFGIQRIFSFINSAPINGGNLFGFIFFASAF